MPGEGHSYERKLRTAYDHLETLRAEIAAWAGSHPYKWTSEYDEDAQEQIYYAELIDPPFDRFGSVAGDCLHNICSALDHLVFEIADKTAEGALPADVRKQSEFPVFGPHPMDKAARKRKIGTLPVDTQEFIESMQPSRMGADYEKHMLWVLHDLERIDKHRMPLSAGPMFGDMTISVPASAGIKARPGGRARYQVQFNTDAKFDGRTEMARFPSSTPAGPEDMKLEISLLVLLDDEFPVGGNPLIYVVQELFEFVLVEIVKPLKKYLDGA